MQTTSQATMRRGQRHLGFVTNHGNKKKHRFYKKTMGFIGLMSGFLKNPNRIPGFFGICQPWSRRVATVARLPLETVSEMSLKLDGG
jgi:hypothetical protein